MALADRPFGFGGEASIYALPWSASLVAKVYHHPDPTRARKLMTMIANPPKDPMAAHGHTSIAWPLDLLSKRDREVVGFLMPRVSGTRALIDLYNPKTRREQCPMFDYAYLHRTAHNLAIAFRALHSAGVVIGDVNESNILVTDSALVTLVDTDSFQVRDARSGATYRCRVGKPEFTPPELQGRPYGSIDRSIYHDRFALAVIIFLLLMEGAHPFAGVYRGRGEPPTYGERIAAGQFPYGGGSLDVEPMPLAPSFELLNPRIRELTMAAFELGHTAPYARPSAQDWRDALAHAERSLHRCRRNSNHAFGKHLRRCPWCERTEVLGGRDPFPAALVTGDDKKNHAPRRRKRNAPSPVDRLAGTTTAVSYVPATAPSPSALTTTHAALPIRSRNPWAYMAAGTAFLTSIPGAESIGISTVIVFSVMAHLRAREVRNAGRWLLLAAVAIAILGLLCSEFVAAIIQHSKPFRAPIMIPVSLDEADQPPWPKHPANYRV